MGKYFGTDGFRGEAGVTLTAEKAFRIGRYLGYHIKDLHSQSNYRPRIVIGKDTRISSYMLEYAISSGLSASGADVSLLHVTTTPCVSYVTVTDGFDCGVMITASHNPFYDNGIKIIDSRGEKLDDGTADLIERYIDALSDEIPLARGAEIGKIHDYYQGRNRYIGYLISLASSSYKGLKIGLDSANGSAFAISRAVFSALGAEIHAIGDEPNGTNVNDNCGSTHPERLARLVKDNDLDIGFAFDGDADRCIAVDNNGHVVDGDRIIYTLAKRLKRNGMLSKNTVVATVMSNGGLVSSLGKIGIKTELTKVGDRFVYERMRQKNVSLGGEESGHIILSKYATTGDGILTAIMLLEEICDTKTPLSELYADFINYPQISTSIKVKDKTQAANDAELLDLKKSIEREIGECGRVLIRESGTEPKLRIMIEARSDEQCQMYIDALISVLKNRGHIDA